jgi:hypothetical protein
MQQAHHKELIEQIVAYCSANGVSKAEFGRVKMRDPSFVYDLEKGRQCLPKTVSRVVSGLSEPMPPKGDAA